MTHESLAIDKQKSSNGDTNFDLDSDRVKPKEKWFVQRIVVKDETSNFTKIEVGRVRGKGFEVYDEEKTLTASVSYAFTDQLVLEPGDLLRVRFIGTSTDDVLTAKSMGFIKRYDK